MSALPSFMPDDAAAVAALLARAAADGTALVPHGSSTKMPAHPFSDRTAALSTSKLTSGLAHYAGDLVATAPAGCTLREVNDALVRQGQWIPIDPPFSQEATIGGIVAVNDSGPRRHRFGSPRDLIIGIEVALTSGVVARSGGRVVKNVAGYDLARLFCGSRGSLGVITSVTFKLAPVAPASRTVAASFSTARQAADLANVLSADASLAPSTLEVVVPGPRLLVRFESTERSAERMASAAAAHLANGSAEVTVLTGEAEASVWAAHHRLESEREGLVAAVSTLPTMAASVLDDVERLGAEFGVRWSATGRVALGLLRIRATGEPNAVQRFSAALRVAMSTRNGHVQFSGDRALLHEQVDPWGPLGSSEAVAFAVKQRFDPAGVLPYPWTRG